MSQAEGSGGPERFARRVLWVSGWLGVASLVAWAIAPTGSRVPEPISPVRRLLGPVASLAASAQWVRFDLALRDGDEARALALADSALHLDPADPAGWTFLAHHLVYERGSLDREPDVVERSRWIRLGLDVLRRGERECRDPGALLLERGIALAYLGSLADEDRAWPATAQEAWRLAAESFEAAAVRSRPRATGAAEEARRRAAGPGPVR